MSTPGKPWTEGPVRPRWVKLGLIGWTIVFVLVGAAYGTDALLNSREKGGPGDVRIVSCSSDGGRIRASVTVTNSGSRSATYSGFVVWYDSTGGRVNATSVEFDDLRPGQSAQQDVVHPSRTAVSCRLDMTRTANSTNILELSLPSLLVVVGIGIIALVTYRRRPRRVRDSVHETTGSAAVTPPGPPMAYAVPVAERALLALLLPIAMFAVFAFAARGIGAWAILFPGTIILFYAYWVFWKLSWDLMIDGSRLQWRGPLRHGSVAISDIIRVRYVRMAWRDGFISTSGLRFTVRGSGDITIPWFPGLAELVVALRPLAPQMDDWELQGR
jgi:hypothetical protein